MVKRSILALLLVACAPLRASAQAYDPSGNAKVVIEPVDATYSAYALSISNPNAGVVFTITGAASHIIRIRSCVVVGTATTAAYGYVLGVVYSAAVTGGTGSAAGIGSMDSGNPGTAATSMYYTAPPTGGTLQATAFLQEGLLESSTPGTQPPQAIFMNFPVTSNAQPPTLRSASQQFAIFVTPAITGASWSVSCKFTDTSS